MGCPSMMYDSSVRCSRVGDVLNLFRVNKIWADRVLSRVVDGLRIPFFSGFGRLSV